jgi:hypothetical protein
MSNELTGKVEKILIANNPNSMASVSQKTVMVTFEGFEGDKHSGLTKPSDGRTKFYPRGTKIRNNRQISIISTEEMLEVANELNIPALLPEWMGANLLVNGIPTLTSLKPNTRLLFTGGPTLLITEENFPCMILTKEICSHFKERPDLEVNIIKAAIHKRGLVAVVELPGVIKEGDEVRVL